MRFADHARVHDNAAGGKGIAERLRFIGGGVSLARESAVDHRQTRIVPYRWDPARPVAAGMNTGAAKLLAQPGIELRAEFAVQAGGEHDQIVGAQPNAAGNTRAGKTVSRPGQSLTKALALYLGEFDDDLGDGFQDGAHLMRIVKRAQQEGTGLDQFGGHVQWVLKIRPRDGQAPFGLFEEVVEHAQGMLQDGHLVKIERDELGHLFQGCV